MLVFCIFFSLLAHNFLSITLKTDFIFSEKKIGEFSNSFSMLRKFLVGYVGSKMYVTSHKIYKIRKFKTNLMLSKFQ